LHLISVHAQYGLRMCVHAAGRAKRTSPSRKATQVRAAVYTKDEDLPAPTRFPEKPAVGAGDDDSAPYLAPRRLLEFSLACGRFRCPTLKGSQVPVDRIRDAIGSYDVLSSCLARLRQVVVFNVSWSQLYRSSPLNGRSSDPVSSLSSLKV
jgi:hypothetical protein